MMWAVNNRLPPSFSLPSETLALVKSRCPAFLNEYTEMWWIFSSGLERLGFNNKIIGFDNKTHKKNLKKRIPGSRSSSFVLNPTFGSKFYISKKWPFAYFQEIAINIRRYFCFVGFRANDHFQLKSKLHLKVLPKIKDTINPLQLVCWKAPIFQSKQPMTK